MGFKPLTSIRKFCQIKPANFIYPDDKVKLFVLACFGVLIYAIILVVSNRNGNAANVTVWALEL